MLRWMSDNTLNVRIKNEKAKYKGERDQSLLEVARIKYKMRETSQMIIWPCTKGTIDTTSYLYRPLKRGEKIATQFTGSSHCGALEKEDICILTTKSGEVTTI